MFSVKKKLEKPNSELTTMQIFSKALTGGSEWCDKVNAAMWVSRYAAPAGRWASLPES